MFGNCVKKKIMNMCLFLNGYGNRAFWIHRHKIIVNTIKERSCLLLIFII